VRLARSVNPRAPFGGPDLFLLRRMLHFAFPGTSCLSLLCVLILILSGFSKDLPDFLQFSQDRALEEDGEGGEACDLEAPGAAQQAWTRVALAVPY
jgi:hypothetical protein